MAEADNHAGTKSLGGPPSKVWREYKKDVVKEMPKYVRVNTLMATFAQVKKGLLQTGHVFVKPVNPNKERRMGFRRPKRQKKVNKREYVKDAHVPDLLVFYANGSDIVRQPMLQTGELVLQSKSSCFSALALDPPPGSHVIDACAAPGSKTSHVASLMQNSGKVFAFDRSANRLQTLTELMRQRNVQIVTAVCADFLKVDPADKTYAAVSHILLDPSCSSSGCSSNPVSEPAAITALSNSQTAIVLHAMRFPGAKVVVYSTCSENDEENELVVKRVLDQAPHFELETTLPQWPRRGRALWTHTRGRPEQCVRAHHLEDNTIGFFVARFVRRGGMEPLRGVPVEGDGAMVAGGHNDGSSDQEVFTSSGEEEQGDAEDQSEAEEEEEEEEVSEVGAKLGEEEEEEEEAREATNDSDDELPSATRVPDPQPADVGKLRKMGGRQRRKERERRLREASGAGKGAGFNQLGGQGLASKPNPGRPWSSDGKGPKKRKR